MFYVPDVFLISLFKVSTCLSNVYFACVICKFIDSALLLFLCIAGYFLFCEL